MTTLTIYDTILVPRPVELPDACPNCQASLLHGHNLAEWDLTEVQYRGNLQAETYLVDGEHNRGDENYPVAYVCLGCNHSFADGRFESLSPSQLPASIAALLSSPPVPPSI